MLRNFAVALTLLISTVALADELSGTIWWAPKKDGRIGFYEKDNKLYGSVQWVPESMRQKQDFKNPNPQLRKQKILNSLVFIDFQKETANTWSGGKIYDSRSGRFYSGKIQLRDSETLEVRGFLGHPIFGITENFRRFDSHQN